GSAANQRRLAEAPAKAFPQSAGDLLVVPFALWDDRHGLDSIRPKAWQLLPALLLLGFHEATLGRSERRTMRGSATAAEEKHRQPKGQHHSTPEKVEVDPQRDPVDGTVAEGPEEDQHQAEDSEHQPYGYADIQFQAVLLLPEHNIEQQRHGQYDDGQGFRARKPLQMAFAELLRKRINQAGQIRIRPGPCEEADENREHKTGAPGVDGGPEVLCHLAGIDLNDGDPAALDSRGRPAGERKPVVDGCRQRPQQQSPEGAVTRDSLPKHPQ